MSKNKVTKAKSHGLKSTIVSNGVLYTTSFGAKNKADIEYIYADQLYESKDDHKYKLEVEEKKLNVKFDKVKTDVPNPLSFSKVGQDYVGLKDILETKFYGRTFNDNLHIQIIYNILDISKCLNLHSNDLIFALNNLARGNVKDSISSIPDFVQFEEYAKEDFPKYFDAAKKNFYLFDNAFKKDNKGNYDEKDVYSSLKLISYFRQMSTHFDAKNDGKLFDLDETLNKEDYLPLKYKLDKNFNETINTIQKDFAKNSMKNVYILASLHNTNNYQQIYNDYFNFSMFKDHKNIGVNLRTIREKIVEQLPIEEETLIKIRKKLNMVLDFEIYNILIKSDKLESYISSLRECGGNDILKDKIYNSIANYLAPRLPKLSFLVRTIEENLEEEFNLNIKDIKLNLSVSMFAKLLFFVSKFLEEKEANDLFTRLINGFENISSLMVLGREIDADLGEKEVDIKLSLFKVKPSILAQELRMCKNFYHMSKTNKKERNADKKKFTTANYRDALLLLGCPKESVEQEMDELNEIIVTKDGRKMLKKLNLRNVLENSILNSKRYRYIVKYSDPSTCLSFIKNDAIIDYLLNDLPESKLISHYKSCTDDQKETNLDVIKNRLKEIIKEFNYYKLKQQESVTIKDKEVRKVEKNRLINISGLILTMIYLVCKNLVYINAVHSIAFSCYERDYNLLIGSGYIKDPFYTKNCLKLVESKLAKMKKRVREYTISNINAFNALNGKKDLFLAYRNSVCHLNIVTSAHLYLDNFTKMESYYGLYEFLLQKYLIKENDIKGYEAYSKSYSKDFSKYLNVPFAYNLARYKNLTIEDLFNDKYNENKE